MSLDLGETLRRAWNIGWNHRVLWLIELIPGVFMLAVFPLVFLANPAFSAFMPKPWNQAAYNPSFVTASAGATILMVLFAGLLAALAQAVTMMGALEVERGAGKLRFQTLLGITLPFFSPILGLYLILGSAWALVLLIYTVLGSAVSVFTFGLGFVCLAPLSILLFFVLGFAVFALLQLGQAAILADRLSVPDSISKAWHIIRGSPLTVVIFLFILQFLFSLVMSLLTIPLLSPMLLLSLLTGFSRDFQSTMPAVFMVVFPIVVFVMLSAQGILMVFFQSAWAVAYLHLTGKHSGWKHQPAGFSVEGSGKNVL